MAWLASTPLSRRQYLAATLAAAPLSLSACELGPGAAPSTAPSKLKTGITLRLPCLGCGGDYERFRREELAAFEQRYPGIKAEFVPATGNYSDKILTMLAAGDPPDVFSNEPSPLPAYVEKQQIIPLDPLIARDKYPLTDFFPKALDQYRWKGKLYGLLWMGFRAFFYNVDAFTQGGAPPPRARWNDAQWNWDRFLDTARRLTRPGDVARFGCVVSRGGTRDWGGWVWSNGGEVFNKDLTQCTLNQPPAVEAFQFMHDLMYKHRVAPTPAGEAQAQGALKMFTGGLSAINWFVAGSVWNNFKEVSFQWGALPTPRGKSGRTSVVTGGGQAWFIPKQARYQDESWELVKWVVSPEMMTKEVQEGLTVPARKSVANSTVWLSRRPPAHMGLLVEAMDYLHTDPLLVNIVEVRQVIEQNLAELWQDKRSAADVTGDIVRLVNPMLGAGS